jgi:hypothetical protein
MNPTSRGTWATSARGWSRPWWTTCGSWRCVAHDWWRWTQHGRDDDDYAFVIGRCRGGRENDRRLSP